MYLKGWAKPLPEWLVTEIQKGTIKVYETKDGEFLKGEAINPSGMVISFK